MLVVQIRLPASAKALHFNANGIEFDVGEKAIVESDKGPEFGEVVRASYESPHWENPAIRLRRVIRRANSEDEIAFHRRTDRQKDAGDFCRQRIRERHVPMDLVKCEQSPDGRKMTFYFTADGRVDFRELVKDLAQHLRARVEMRQIGPRDAARVRGGFGHCGRPLCCATWLREFAPVSIKMAKAQGLSMNPTKISGMCGRLMCCLKYEIDASGVKKPGCGSGGCGAEGGCATDDAGRESGPAAQA